MDSEEPVVLDECIVPTREILIKILDEEDWGVLTDAANEHEMPVDVFANFAVYVGIGVLRQMRDKKFDPLTRIRLKLEMKNAAKKIKKELDI